MKNPKSSHGTAKTPFYKKWWFWLIIVVLGIAGIGSNQSSKNGKDLAVKPSSSASIPSNNVSSMPSDSPKDVSPESSVDIETPSNSSLHETSEPVQSIPDEAVSLPDTQPEVDSTPTSEYDEVISQAPVQPEYSDQAEATDTPTTENSTENSDEEYEEVPEGSEMSVWVPTNGGKKYHRTAYCSGMKDPIQISESEAIAQDYTPCKRCYG